MLNKMIFVIVIISQLCGQALAQPAWETEIQVQGDNVTIQMAMGGHTTGTDAFDAGFDSLAPPVPPSDYYAYFQITDPIFNFLAKDIRGWQPPYATERNWTLEIKNADAIETTVSWNGDDFPGEGFFTLIDTISVDMRTNTSFTFTGNRTLLLRYSLSAHILLNLKIFLEGPYQSDNMNTMLNLSDYIPLESPYGDSREVVTIPENIVDWVRVELRSVSEGPTVASQSFFVRNDGMIVDLDGTTTDLQFDDVNSGYYYIVVKHRNHLSVMSAEAQYLSP